jgi:hypothetical protein
MMIASIADAGTASSGLRYAIDRAGQAFGPSSLDASTDLDAVFADFMLPTEVLDCLRPPFEQLGFALEAGTLNLSPNLPAPPTYTVARRGALELALIRLPHVLFGATTPVNVFIANGIGYSFQKGARLHLFAADEDGTTEFLDTAIKSWTRDGVDAVFHPWRRIGELEAARDRAAFVARVFELGGELNGNPPADVPAPPPPTARQDLDKDQFLALLTALNQAFPNYDELQLMLRAHVGKRLTDITPADKLSFVVLDVIQAAEAQGWLGDLIAGARAAAPGSVVLQEAAQKIPAALGGEGP